jgi:hypothetical protein
VAAWQWGLEWRALGVNELEPARRLGNNSTAGRGAKFLSTLHEPMTASVSMEASARAMRCQRRCRCRCRSRCRCRCRSSGSTSPKKVVWKTKRPSPSARSVHAPIGPFTCACLTSLATGDAEGQTSLKHRNKEGPSRPSTPGGSDQNSQRGGCSKEPPARAHAALASHSHQVTPGLLVVLPRLAVWVGGLPARKGWDPPARIVQSVQSLQSGAVCAGSRPSSSHGTQSPVACRRVHVCMCGCSVLCFAAGGPSFAHFSSPYKPTRSPRPSPLLSSLQAHCISSSRQHPLREPLSQ